MRVVTTKWGPIEYLEIVIWSPSRSPMSSSRPSLKHLLLFKNEAMTIPRMPPTVKRIVLYSQGFHYVTKAYVFVYTILRIAPLYRYISSVVDVRHPTGEEGLLLQPQCTWWMNDGGECLQWNTMCLVRDCRLMD